MCLTATSKDWYVRAEGVGNSSEGVDYSKQQYVRDYGVVSMSRVFVRLLSLSEGGYKSLATS